jgi:peroxiredoxin
VSCVSRANRRSSAALGGAQLLDRHGAAQALIARGQDPPHAAARQLGDLAVARVVGERLVELRRHRPVVDRGRRPQEAVDGGRPARRRILGLHGASYPRRRSEPGGEVRHRLGPRRRRRYGRPMIQAGDPVPSVTIQQATVDGPAAVDPAALFAGKHVVLFAVPGAFTPTCSTQHLPGYVARLDEFAARGVDLVACLAVNDAWVLQAWAARHGALGKIVMLADGNGAFTRALGLDVELAGAGLGVRARRGLITFKDGKAALVAIEAPGRLEVSGADACLVTLA